MQNLSNQFKSNVEKIAKGQQTVDNYFSSFGSTYTRPSYEKTVLSQPFMVIGVDPIGSGKVGP